MAGIYDTHTHLNDEVYLQMDTTAGDLIKSAQQAGVSMLNVVGYDVKSSKIALRYASVYPNVYAIIGIHPNEAQYFTSQALDAITEMTSGNNVVAIGEIGLDYSRTNKFKEEQKAIFIAQIKIALDRDLPVVLHVKDVKDQIQAYQDSLEILDQYKVKNAVIHSWEGNEQFAEEFLNRGYYLSFSGMITYPENEVLATIVQKMSLNQLLIETDAPYNSPIPFEGKVNYPRLAPIIVKKIAKLKKLDSDDIISATRKNGERIFRIK
ncbi:D-aminoacyl-tRNA deacylase [Mesoplasma sp. JKS002658]|uniref:TatD family hydrolase n=1 Tax=Mesoplasma whartonense TaxID=2878854 RepID=UPI002022B078|nr:MULTISPECIES: TatD family hydrolase [unclassified Mesoplasma]MCL8211623.1 D-aminoacyl-tRNA deacylase [Mesoplasma sp. JKS002664]MCL8212362.1 D-aminoacyl-tRNA deacylase [Mesoplasma sp. JKS002662]MCL8212797.1 D-aminoacyl-tRNA deacylase [Mesoplasma sp. JKS002661]MCL8213510.1 D-aminoacyl-tRNA deacylase [Mesoplasma sp. JKS002660]MCL8214393.1 D-aminoacyl-tRNA deacylase [Mesoplasma sp. JKS002658]